MKTKKKPTYITCVDELFKYYLIGSEKDLYVSNLISPVVVEFFAEFFSSDIEITIFDYREFYGQGFVDLKRNGRVKFELNKNITIYKQKYYYWSKSRKKYKTTMWSEYIDKYCNYTRSIQYNRLIESKICYTSYENTADAINEKNNLNISRQSIYLYEKKHVQHFYHKEKPNYGKK